LGAIPLQRGYGRRLPITLCSLAHAEMWSFPQAVHFQTEVTVPGFKKWFVEGRGGKALEKGCTSWKVGCSLHWGQVRQSELSRRLPRHYNPMGILMPGESGIIIPWESFNVQPMSLLLSMTIYQHLDTGEHFVFSSQGLLSSVLNTKSIQT